MSAIRVPLLTDDNPDLPTLEVIAASQKKFPPRNQKNTPYQLVILRCGSIKIEESTYLRMTKRFSYALLSLLIVDLVDIVDIQQPAKSSKKRFISLAWKKTLRCCTSLPCMSTIIKRRESSAPARFTDPRSESRRVTSFRFPLHRGVI